MSAATTNISKSPNISLALSERLVSVVLEALCDNQNKASQCMKANEINLTCRIQTKKKKLLSCVGRGLYDVSYSSDHGRIKKNAA